MTIFTIAICTVSQSKKKYNLSSLQDIRAYYGRNQPISMQLPFADTEKLKSPAVAFGGKQELLFETFKRTYLGLPRAPAHLRSHIPTTS
jgi:RNA:NAD 2'-phosphotransferase (TPT1/KptA family)